MARQGFLGMLAGIALDVLAQATKPQRKAGSARKRDDDRSSAPRAPRPAREAAREVPPQAADARSGVQTVEVDPSDVRDLVLSYAPDRDGAPDGGEIIWTWVPYAENDGRGKDRPVLVLGRHTSDRSYAVKLTSKSHDGDREYVSIGSGEWDAQGRESWVDLDQLYSVHVDGMRREAAELDRRRFERVAQELVRRYGWRTGE
ncbi:MULTISPECIES: type II toxin-antitoxin system PemK/MazF family toxin [Microbacterium]|uniref:type II toxin-antitoxin system PemK/MazF family toxin n=1 Tax=Microbacterium TaxID=33882 RepID=UPI0024AFC7D1|nr:type II toxin-antitoxin system PemK/MazF family toxin [Microbacterium barkeri]MDI6942361.1 type II toxin-antitoxin system PemK/MazF family toxin [Microbacterium barkeri]